MSNPLRPFNPAAYDEHSIREVLVHLSAVEDLGVETHDDMVAQIVEHRIDTAEQALRETAKWLVAQGYPYDWRSSEAPPAALWESVVDVAHADADGSLHGNELTRPEVDSWLRYEAGIPEPETGQEGQ